MNDSVLGQIAALKTMPIADLKAKWRELYGSEAPPHNRAFLESRIGYRLQELRYGGLKPDTLRRLAALADELERDDGPRKRRARDGNELAAGTRLVRDWKGVEHCVTVRADGFEYDGRPFKSLSAVARAITGTRWNGPLFFGLKQRRGQP
jgi:hypothetical protein